MITLLRKIRRRLLAENKFSRYLLYAAGEIALVVVGILIALQINTWNENKTLDEIRTVNYLQLLEDLKTDEEYIEEKIEGMNTSIPLYRAYLKSFDTLNLNLQDVMDNQNKLDFSPTTLRFHNSTIVSLENTGEMKLIPSALRKKLTDLKRDQDYTTATSDQLNQYFFDRIENAGIYGSQPQFQNRIKNHPLLREALGIEANLPKIIWSIEIAMLYKNWNERSTVGRLQQLQTDIKEISELIHTELDHLRK